MSFVSIRVNVDPTNGYPHTYLAVTHPDGRKTEYGLVPKDHSKDSSYGASGPGNIDITGPGVGTKPHLYDYEGPVQQLTDAQYQKLMEGINRSIANPPNYLLPGNWASDYANPKNCTGWAIDAWRYAGLPDDFGVTSWVFSPYGQAVTLSISKIVNTATTAARNWVAPRDPLVLDLDGGGIKTSAINPDAPLLFDQNGDGIKTASGWIGAGEAIVVRDVNNNGTIDSGRELFGDSTILTHGVRAGQTAANGFEALADLDSNQDGQFNSADAAYASVKLWKDANQDGISQSTELFGFDQLGVQSINVAGTASNVNLVDANGAATGNTQTFAGSFTRTDGQTGNAGTAELAASLLLASNNFYREFSDDPVVSADAAVLPQMQGNAGSNSANEPVFARLA